MRSVGSAFVMLVLASFALPVLVGCGGESNVTQSAESTTKSDVSAAGDSGEQPSQRESAPGTKDNPYPLGTPGRMEDWEFTITAVDPEASDLVEAAHSGQLISYRPPIDGSQYMMVTIKSKYVGEGSGVIIEDVAQRTVVGSGGNTFQPATLDRVFAPLPDFILGGEVFAGGDIVGNEVFMVPTDQIEGAVLFFEADEKPDIRAFFALN